MNSGNCREMNKSVAECRGIAFTGGGSGGHIHPGLAVWEEVRDHFGVGEPERNDLAEAGFFWIGTTEEKEAALVQQAGLSFVPISSGKLRRYFSLKLFPDLFRMLKGILQSCCIMRRRRPTALFAKGGAVSFPAVLGAWLNGIPVLVHDSDLDPGLTTRLCAPFAAVIMVPYEESVSRYARLWRKKLIVTGNPVRKAVASMDSESVSETSGPFDFPGLSGWPKVLIVGGSGGSARLNRIVSEARNELAEFCRIVHITGENAGGAAAGPCWHSNYRSIPYIGEGYGRLLSQADIVVSRAGAGALWEAAVLHKPMVLVPKSRRGSRGDQIRNAEFFAAHDAAIVLDEDRTDTVTLKQVLLTLIGDKVRRSELTENAGRLCRPQAAGVIAGLLMRSAAAMGGRL